VIARIKNIYVELADVKKLPVVLIGKISIKRRNIKGVII
tara:strand:+ start:540 stop:656 length:117 start_codon:yes stop_codon:yes gene_type:complete